MAPLHASDTVAVVGAGTMGTGIAQIAAAAGHPVLLYDHWPDAVDRSLTALEKTLERVVARGKMTPEERLALLARITPCGELAALKTARLVVEAIVESLEIKRKLFADVEKLVDDEAVLATNTSSISITAIASGLQRPERLVGMHFFNPVPLMALVEIISGVATEPRVADMAYERAAAWGKSPVYARSTPGFIVNRVARPFYAEALRVLQEGAAEPETLDALMRDAGGFRMGPFELMDLIGHDVNFAVTRSVFEAHYYDPRFTPSLIQQELVEAGFLGRKSGRGFFRYDEAERPQPQTASDVDAPSSIVAHGDLGPLAPLVELLASKGIDVGRASHETGGGWIELDGRVAVAMTDGRSATERMATELKKPLVLVDLARDLAQATRIGLTPADQTTESERDLAVGLFQLLDKAVSVIADVPGMLVMRTVCMLANEAADAVNQGVCDTESVDTAMRKGVNYPQGPMEWARRIGLGYVVGVLSNLATGYGEDRYRVSPLLRRLLFAEAGPR